MKENLSTTSKSREKTINTQSNLNKIQNTVVIIPNTGTIQQKEKEEEIVLMNEDVLNSFDFSAIDRMDPSLTDNFKKILDKELEVDLKMVEMDTKPEVFKEKVRFRLFTHGEEGNPKNVKYEIFSDFDIFFIYYNMLDPINFKDLQTNQKLNIEYKGINHLIKSLIDNLLKKPESFTCMLTIVKDGISNISFKKKAEFKTIDVLTLTLGAPSEEYTKKQVIYRFNSAKSKLDIMQARLTDIYSIVGVKNPSLLTQIKKTPAKMGNQSDR